MSLQTLANACESAEQHVDDLSGKPKSSITRARQQLSCAACHKRKQKCDREQPCGNCVKRGVGDECHIAEKGTNKVHRRAGSETLPAAVVIKKRKLDSPLPPDGVSSGEEGYSLSGLINASTNGSSTTYNYLGPSSVYDFIGKSTSDKLMVGSLVSNSGCMSKITNPEIVKETVTKLIAQLPNRIVCDRLVDEFYKLEFLMWLFAVSHRPSFDPSYRAMWYYAPANPYNNNLLGMPPQPPLNLTISFIANVCMMLAISLQFLTDDLAYLTGGNTTAMKEQLYLLARHALIESEMKETADRCRSETILMLGIYAKNEGNAGEIFHHVASAIRVAQSIGMHRKTAPEWNIDPLEDELRRRQWAALYAYDRFCSIGYGRPYVIHDSHCDQVLPANIDDVDLTLHGVRNVKPLNVVTDATYLLLETKFSKILAKAFEECFSIKQPTYATVLELDSEMHNFEISLPTQFRSPSTEEMHRKPKVTMQYGLLTAQICKAREALHRPFLLRDIRPGEPDRYSRSRLAAVSLARRSLHAMKEVLSFLHPKFPMLSHVCFDAGASLCVAASIEKKKNTPASLQEVKRMDETVRDAINVLNSIAYCNRMAKESSAALTQLREKLYAGPPLIKQEPALPDSANIYAFNPNNALSAASRSPDEFLAAMSHRPSFMSVSSSSPSDYSTPSSSTDFQWQSPFPPVASNGNLDPSLEMPILANDDFLSAPADLSFPSLFSYIGDQTAFDNALESLIGNAAVPQNAGLAYL